MPDEPGVSSIGGRRTAARELTPKVAGALRRYRIASFVVGVGLLILVVTMVLKYTADMGWTVAVWGPIHGVLYAVYVLLAFDLSYRAGWKLTNLLKVLLAGVVPVLSFFTEHWVNRKMLAGERL